MADIPFDEAEAARRLGISKASLSRARIAGQVHPLRIGPRLIRYTDDILEEFKQQCRNAPAKSETTGSANAQARSSGVAPGTKQTIDRRSAHHLAQTIFKKAS